MSVVRNRHLKKRGLNKKLYNKCRKNVDYRIKCNILFYVNNFSFKNGLLDSFIMQSITFK